MPTVTSGGASNAWEEQSSVNDDGNPVSVLEQQPLPADEPEPEETLLAASYTPAEVHDAVGLAPAQVEGEGAPQSDAPPASETTPDGPGTVAEHGSADYASMSHAALRDEAKARGLPASGAKADLAARLTEHDATAAADASPDAEVGD